MVPSSLAYAVPKVAIAWYCCPNIDWLFNQKPSVLLIYPPKLPSCRKIGPQISPRVQTCLLLRANWRVLSGRTFLRPVFSFWGKSCVPGFCPGPDLHLKEHFLQGIVGNYCLYSCGREPALSLVRGLLRVRVLGPFPWVARVCTGSTKRSGNEGRGEGQRHENVFSCELVQVVPRRACACGTG